MPLNVELDGLEQTRSLVQTCRAGSRADCRQGQIISCQSLCEAVDFSSPFSFPRFVHGMCVGWGRGVWREGEKEQKFPGTDYVNTSKYSSVIINQKLENCEVL